MMRWLKVLVSIGVLALLLTLLPWQAVREAWNHLSLMVWAGVFGGFVAGHLVGTAKWRMMISIGASRLPWRDAGRCYAAGLFANLCLPSIVGGDILRATLAARQTRQPEAVVLGSLADRLLDLTTMGLLIGIGGVLAGRALVGWGLPLVALGLLMSLGLGLTIVLLQRPLARWPARYRRIVGRSLVALRRLRRTPRVAMTALGLSLLVQTGFVLLNAWIGLSIGIEAPVGVWFLVWPLAKVAGLLPISLGGLGVRDATLAGLLVPFGVPAAHGLVASLIWQTVLLAGGLCGGLLWWLLSRPNAQGQRASLRRLLANARQHAND